MCTASPGLFPQSKQMHSSGKKSLQSACVPVSANPPTPNPLLPQAHSFLRWMDEETERKVRLIEQNHQVDCACYEWQVQIHRK